MSSTRHRRAVVALALVALAVAACTVAACAKQNGTNGQGNVGSLGAAPSPPPVAAPSPAPTTVTSTPPTGATKTTKSGARILTFDVKQKPSCPVIASSDSPFGAPGQDVILEWSVTGATGIALSIDNPDYYDMNHMGSYGSYGPTGEVDISFPCDQAQQPNTTHQYTLNTVGGTGPSVSMTLKVSAQTNP